MSDLTLPWLDFFTALGEWGAVARTACSILTGYDVPRRTLMGVALKKVTEICSHRNVGHQAPEEGV
ncbi:MAG: hypothetical protein ACFCVA_19385 [Gammaproteobacteria bacterium]